MPDTLTIPNQPSTNVPLNRGEGRSQRTDNLTSEQEGDEAVGVTSKFLRVSRLFVGSWLSCLNLPLKITDVQEVVSYLSQHPNASAAIEETYFALKDFFSSSPIRLEIYPDPKGERSPELALIVETEEEPDIALEKLDHFDEEFWLSHMDQFGEILSVHVEYQ